MVYYNERNKEKENRDYYERFDEEYRRQLSFRESNNEREKLWRNNFQQMPLYSPDESFLDEFNSKFKRKCSLDEEIERRNDEFQNRRDIESSFRRNSSRNVGLDHFDIDSLSVHRRESIEKRSYFDYNEFLNTDEKPVSVSIHFQNSFS